MARLHPAIALGTARPFQPAEEELASRIRMILETRPGQVPWRPEFGCDLRALIGRQASPETLTAARFQVQQALSRWLPEVSVKECRVRVIRDRGNPDRYRHPSIPKGEAALVGVGPQAAVTIDVDLETEAGLLTVSATVD